MKETPDTTEDALEEIQDGTEGTTLILKGHLGLIIVTTGLHGPFWDAKWTYEVN